MSGGLAAVSDDRRRPAGSVMAPGVILKLQAAVLSQTDLARSVAALATELAGVLRCDRVTVGWLERGCARVIATSHGVEFDARQALFEKIGAAMDEAIEQAATIVLPAAESSSPCVTLAHAEVLAFLGGGVCTVVRSAPSRSSARRARSAPRKSRFARTPPAPSRRSWS
jgi:hypothetical protein